MNRYIDVSKHCVVRYIERVLRVCLQSYRREVGNDDTALYSALVEDGFPINDIETYIRCSVSSAVTEGYKEATIEHDGVQYVLKGNIVATVKIQNSKHTGSRAVSTYQFRATDIKIRKYRK